MTNTDPITPAFEYDTEDGTHHEVHVVTAKPAKDLNSYLPALVTALGHVAWWLALPMVWSVQACWVAAVILWQALVFGTKAGVVGVALLCIPFVGWIVLIWLLFRSRPVRTAPGPVARALKPWLWTQYLGWARSR